MPYWLVIVCPVEEDVEEVEEVEEEEIREVCARKKKTAFKCP